MSWGNMENIKEEKKDEKKIEIELVDNLEEEINIGVSCLLNRKDLEQTKKIKVSIILEKIEKNKFIKELSNFEWIK